MKNFSLKFVDIMIAVVLGLGFQWWTSLKEPWQYIAFIFVYLDIVDYWIDYSPSLKKFPPKKEIDVMLDVFIMFSLFLYIYSAQLTIMYFLGAFILFKILDYFWLLSSKLEYKPIGLDGLFIETWLKLNLIEVIATGLLIGFCLLTNLPSIIILISYITIRIIIRVIASLKYKKIHFS